LKTFKVYKHPTQGFEAVKVGFSWPAFWFGIIWMFVKNLWGLAGLWVAGYTVLFLVEIVATQSQKSGEQALVFLLVSAGYFALWLVPAFRGNNWREENLSKRGYELISTVQTETPDAAIGKLAKTI
jgi:hypothetical protein